MSIPSTLRSRRFLAAAGLVLALAIGLSLVGPPKSDHREWKQGLACVALAFTLIGQRESRRPSLQWVACTGLALTLATSFWIENGRNWNKLVRGKYIQVWNTYHYYLGSKYFSELGYLDLYIQSLRADEERLGKWKRTRTVMDLRDYGKLTRRQALKLADPNAFSPARWEEFKADLAVLQQHATEDTLKNVLDDHGYNATPFGQFINHALSSAFSIQSVPQRTILLSMDLWAVAGVFILAARAFGLRRSLSAACLYVLFFGTHGFQVGGFFRFDWFVATAAALCLFKMDRPRMAGWALAYGAMTRIFPGFMAFAVMILWAGRTLRTRRLEPATTAFLLHFGLACSVMAALGEIGAPNGESNWMRFKDKMALHSGEHHLGPHRLGLKRLMVYDFEEGAMPKGSAKEATFQQQAATYRMAQLAALALTLAALWRRRTGDAMLAGLASTFWLVVLSRYYWALWVVFLWMDGRAEGDEAPPPAAWDALRESSLYLWVILHYALSSVEKDKWLQYHLANMEQGVTLALLLAGLVALSWRGRLSAQRGQAIIR